MYIVLVIKKLLLVEAAVSD